MTQRTPAGKRWVFRPWITKADGTRIYARQYGKRAFPILVDE